MPRQKELDRLGPADLAKHLPSGAALIDLLRYTRFDRDPQTPGREGERRTPSYAAFVLAPGRSVKRVELGPAAPLDSHIADWRRAWAQGDFPFLLVQLAPFGKPAIEPRESLGHQQQGG